MLNNRPLQTSLKSFNQSRQEKQEADKPIMCRQYNTIYIWGFLWLADNPQKLPQSSNQEF